MNIIKNPRTLDLTPSPRHIHMARSAWVLASRPPPFRPPNRTTWLLDATPKQIYLLYSSELLFSNQSQTTRIPQTASPGTTPKPPFFLTSKQYPSPTHKNHLQPPVPSASLQLSTRGSGRCSASCENADFSPRGSAAAERAKLEIPRSDFISHRSRHAPAYAPAMPREPRSEIRLERRMSGSPRDLSRSRTAPARLRFDLRAGVQPGERDFVSFFGCICVRVRLGFARCLHLHPEVMDALRRVVQQELWHSSKLLLRWRILENRICTTLFGCASTLGVSDPLRTTGC